jgi:hypothetical protein
VKFVYLSIIILFCIGISVAIILRARREHARYEYKKRTGLIAIEGSIFRHKVKEYKGHYLDLPLYGVDEKGLSTSEFAHLVDRGLRTEQVWGILEGWLRAGRARRRLSHRGWVWWRTKA